MSRFNFAHLVGGKPRAQADDDEEAKYDDAPVAEDDEDMPAAEEQDDDPEAKPDDEEATPAARRAARRAAQAERRRCAQIIASATPATMAQAATLAFTTNLSPTQARAVLAAAPQTSGGLAAAMRGRDPAPLAPGARAGGAGDDLPDELKAAQARRLARKER
jgi:hypothetical protein